MRRVFIFSILASVLSMSCTSGDGETIKGSIKGAEGETIYLEKLVNNRWGVSDSTVIGSDGSFLIVPVQPLELDFYRLALSDEDYVILITDSTEHISIKGEAGDLNMKAEVKGSENTTLLREFEQSCMPLFEQEDKALMALQTETSPEGQSQLKSQVIDARKSRSDMVKKWLESNSSTPAALAVVQMLDPRAERSSFNKVIQDVSGQIGHSMHYKMLKQQIERMEAMEKMPAQQETPPGAKIAVGQPAPEIALPDPSGKVRKLSSLKGKVVLIDFWASWCGPCRRENPNVVEAYNEYNKDGFEVFSVSLDKAADPWKEAIAKDGLIWKNHVSDLQFWNSKAAADYGVHSIPFPVLIDKDGNVVAYGNNIRGELLEANLKQIFGR
ncbi:MAG: TlpA disulfide reductase family protein [Flavobacteriales bacterium]